ncbi:hypothetical protein BKA69DRAFT_1088124 [Paraphysoderma sedebokerense]|nr:hypothetical protein BKA69DRAFT_1087986 [Paraphysoderma sedebokerense]KAI9139068.1 hypothetical protein BKA69DRAFT_1088124 [Paraphysoderma sedebokerense]
MYEKLFEFGGDTMSEIERTKIYKRYIDTVYKQLHFLDNEDEKSKLRENLFKICANVIEKQLPVPLAYEIEIESTDAEWSDYPIELLYSYSKAIQIEEPQSSDQNNAFGKLIAGYLHYQKDGLFDDLANEISLTAEKLPDSVFANSFLVFVYLQLKDYESALTVSQKAVEVLNQYEKVTGIQLNKVRMSLQLFTAESYLHLDANQLSSALQIYKDTITALVASKSISSPLYYRSLNGLAQTLLQLQKYPESLKAFTKVYELTPNVTAKSQIGWVHFYMKEYETAEATLKECIEELEFELKKEDDKVQEERFVNKIKENLAECWFRLARVYWGQDGTRLSSALHTALISSAQLNPRYSPTFTYLGHYYRLTDDEIRSLKCYQRAFSIDSGDEDAANWLVELYVKNGEEVKALDVLRKLVATEKGAKSSWAWKALGFAEIKHSNFETAVTNFQTSLRLNVKNVASWEGLAESYLHLGKYMASVKAFTRVIELDPNNVLARYHMGTIYTKLGEFQKGVDAYADALNFLSPDTPKAESRGHWSLFQVPIMKGLGDCYLLYAKDCYAVGRYGMCGELLNKGIEIVHNTLKVQYGAGLSGSSCLWKLLGDLFFTYRYVENWIQKTFQATHVMNEIKQLENDRSALKELNLHDECVEKSHSKSLYFQTLSVSRICYSFAILHSPALYGTYWYDAGMTYFFQERCLNRQETLIPQEKTHEELLGMAIRCLKIALKLEPGNDIFWNALGVALMVAKHPLLSQHCFVKAMEYNPKSTIAWANAGYLYLVQSDLELANQAFSMAQQLDPDWVLSWLGQAFIAELYGSHEASGLFAHSFELSGGMLVEANYKYAAYTFRETVSSKGRQAGEKQFITSIFALRKFVEQSPSSASGHNLLGLLLERQRQYSESVLHFRESLSILQSNLRKTPESSSEYNVIVKRISIVHNNLARVLCSLYEFPKSIKSYRAVAHPNIYTYLGTGLSYYFNNELESSLKEFEKALSMVQEFEETDEKSKNVKNDVSLLLCQVLYALGSPQHIDLAKHQLLECVARTPNYLPALFGLCALGLVIDDGNLALAALRELLSVPADILGENDVDGDAEYLLSRFVLLQSDFDSCKRFLSRAIHRNPSNPVLWSRLSEFLLRYRTSFTDTTLVTAESALALIDKHQTLGNGLSNEILPNILSIQSLSLLSVSDGLPRTGRKAFKMAQRFARLFPSNLESWSTIATCIRSQIAIMKFQSAKNKSTENEIDLLRVILGYTRQIATNNLRDQIYQHNPLAQVTVRRIFNHSSLALADALLLKSEIDISSEQKLDLLKTAVRLCEGTITEAENDITKARGYLQLARILWGTGEIDNAIIAYKNALQLSSTLDFAWLVS